MFLPVSYSNNNHSNKKGGRQRINRINLKALQVKTADGSIEFSGMSRGCHAIQIIINISEMLGCCI